MGPYNLELIRHVSHVWIYTVYAFTTYLHSTCICRLTTDFDWNVVNYPVDTNALLSVFLSQLNNDCLLYSKYLHAVFYYKISKYILIGDLFKQALICFYFFYRSRRKQCSYIHPTSKCSISKNTFQFDRIHNHKDKQTFKKSKIKKNKRSLKIYRFLLSIENFHRK